MSLEAPTNPNRGSTEGRPAVGATSAKGATGDNVTGRLAGPAPALRILDLYPERALHAPGSEARVLIELETDALLTVDLRARLLDRMEPQAQARDIVTLQPGVNRVSLTLVTPATDARGYLVALSVRWPGGEASATTAVLVASHWKLVPRYGFLGHFQPASADADANHAVTMPSGTVVDAAAVEDPVGLLSRFHITAVQFYDWMYRHYRFLPPEDAVRGTEEAFVDAMDREVSLAKVRRKVAACHEHGMAAIAYGAVYGPEPEFILQHPDWLLYDAAGNTLDLIERFYITDIRPGGWREHILGEFERAVSELSFDGIHMDQYGFPKGAYDHAGQAVDVAAAFPGMIDEAAARLARIRDGAAVIFNAVNDWPTDLVAQADQAAIYIEVWSPNDRYRDLVRLVRRARELSGKQAILAAYLRPFHEPGAAAEWSLRYATAIINAAGGHHLILGEGDGVLREPYYPDHGRLSAEGFAVMRRMYDHTAANTQYLHAVDLRAVGSQYATGVNTAVTLHGAAVEVRPTAEAVWLTVARRPGQLVVNLVNLTGLSDEAWDAPRSAPPVLEGLSLELEPFVKDVRATWASPDQPERVQAAPLPGSVAPDGRVTLPLPPLELWGTLVIDHA